MTTEAKGIRLVWADVKESDIGAEILGGINGYGAQLDAAKRRAVARIIGTEPEGDPMQAWLAYLCDLNGLENTRPVPSGLANAILNEAGARRFMFWLA